MTGIPLDLENQLLLLENAIILLFTPAPCGRPEIAQRQTYQGVKLMRELEEGGALAKWSKALLL